MQTLFFLGIRFWNGDLRELLQLADQRGGLFTVPSAPSLGAMDCDPFLALAYRSSDWSVVDGGYVALLLRFLFRKSIRRISGLQILQNLVSPSHEHFVAMEDIVGRA